MALQFLFVGQECYGWGGKYQIRIDSYYKNSFPIVPTIYTFFGTLQPSTINCVERFINLKILPFMQASGKLCRQYVVAKKQHRQGFTNHVTTCL